MQLAFLLFLLDLSTRASPLRCDLSIYWSRRFAATACEILNKKDHVRRKQGFYQKNTNNRERFAWRERSKTPPALVARSIGILEEQDDHRKGYHLSSRSDLILRVACKEKIRRSRYRISDKQCSQKQGDGKQQNSIQFPSDTSPTSPQLTLSSLAQCPSKRKRRPNSIPYTSRRGVVSTALYTVLQGCTLFPLRAMAAYVRTKERSILPNPLLTKTIPAESFVDGTHLPHLSLEEAANTYFLDSNKQLSSLGASNKPLSQISMSSMERQNTSILPMAQWPDPVLRIPATQIDARYFGTKWIYQIANSLQLTCRSAGAVGLAAQQCGVDASMVYLEVEKRVLRARKFPDSSYFKNGILLINPRFVGRSSEFDMRVRNEECLVLPPWFRATVLRDANVVVEAENLEGQTFHISFEGELARAVQHECQHDRGILIIDHVVDEEFSPFANPCVTEQMRQLELPLHSERQLLAFSRPIVASSI